MTRAQHLTMPGAPITIGGNVVVNSTTGTPQIDFNSDGTITYKSNGIAGFFYSRGWYQAANFGHLVTGIGAGYEIRLTPDVGSVGFFGLELTDTWVPLTSGTSWSRIGGNGSSTGLIEIRDATTDVTLASCTIEVNDN